MGVWLLRVQGLSAWVFLAAFLVRHHAPLDELPGAFTSATLAALWIGGGVHAVAGLFQLLADREGWRPWRRPAGAILALTAALLIAAGVTTGAGAPPHRTSADCRLCHNTKDVAGTLHQAFGCEACHRRPAVAEVGCQTCHPRAGDLHGDVATRFPSLLERHEGKDVHGLSCASCHPAPPGR